MFSSILYWVFISVQFNVKVSKVAKIRNRYNQVPHLTQDTNGKVTNSQKTPQTRAKRSAQSSLLRIVSLLFVNKPSAVLFLLYIKFLLASYKILSRSDRNSQRNSVFVKQNALNILILLIQWASMSDYGGFNIAEKRMLI